MSEPSLGQMFNLTKKAPSQPAAPADPPEDSGSHAPTDTASRAEVGERTPGPAPTPPAARPRKRTGERTAATRRGNVHAVPNSAAKTTDEVPAPAAENRASPTPHLPGADKVATPAAADAATPVSPPTARSAEATGGRASIMLYTTPTLEAKMREEAARTSLTYGQLTLICVEHTLDKLRATFAARAGVTSSLFSTDYRQRTRDGEKRGASVNLHIARRDLDIIDQLWPAMPGCKSRNDMLSTAVSLHLTDQPDT